MRDVVWEETAVRREACSVGSPSRVFAAGTGESISARIHAANLQGNRAEEDRRSARRHNTNSLGERIESFVTLVAGIVVAGARISSRCVSRSGGVSQRVKEVQENSGAQRPMGSSSRCMLVDSFYPRCVPFLLLKDFRGIPAFLQKYQ